MQIVSPGDNLHEVSDSIFLKKKKEKKNTTNLSSAESAHSVVILIKNYSAVNH